MVQPPRPARASRGTGTFDSARSPSRPAPTGVARRALDFPAPPGTIVFVHRFGSIQTAIVGAGLLGLALAPGASQARRATVATASGGYTITLHVRGLRNSDGKVLAGLYNKSDGFPVTRDGWIQGQATHDIVSGRATVKFQGLPTGTYAIAVFHDENDNDDLDVSWIGIPKEGTGASNDAHGRLGPPKWKDAKFEVTENTRTTAKIKYYSVF